MCCDLCGIDIIPLENMKSCKINRSLLLAFYWIIRKKKTKDKMILNLVCSKCYDRMKYMVDAVNEIWSIYNLDRNDQNIAVDCKRTEENNGHLGKNEPFVLQSNLEFESINNVYLRYQLESSVMAEGCTQLEWLQNPQNDDLYIKEQLLVTPPLITRCPESTLIVNKVSLLQDSEHKEDFAIFEKENITEVNLRKNRKSKYSAALIEFVNEFIIKEKASNSLVCTLCNKVLSSSKDKVHHIRRIHLKERPFACHNCDHRFTTQRFLNHHMKFVHRGRPYLCHICGIKFKNISIFKSHENKHLGTPIHICPEENCSKSFYGRCALRNHMKGCHSATKHVCEKCGKIFSTAERAKIHSKRHSQRTVKCHLCPQMFFTQSDLGPHMKHHKTWPWKCSKCNMSFKSTRGLQQHSSATHGEKLTRHQLYKKSSGP